MRKGNISTHIQRRHPDQYNPFPQMKESNCNFSQSKKTEPSNFRSPQYDWSDPQQIMERSTKIKNLLVESKNLSKMELGYLLVAIYSQMQSK
jgi:hypothetical protein